MREGLTGQEVLYFLATVLLTVSMAVCFGLLIFLPNVRMMLLHVVLFLGALLNIVVGIHQIAKGKRKSFFFFGVALVCCVTVFFF